MYKGAGDEDLAELPITDLVLVEEDDNPRASSTYRVTLLNDDIGYFKPDDAWQKSYWRRSVPPRTEWRREIAAYRFDRLVGFDLVPVTVAREEDLEDKNGREGMCGSLQAEAPGEGELNVAAYGRLERDSMAVLDYVIGNLDRHGGNYRTFEDGRLAATDHGFAFPTDARDPIRSSFVKDVIHKPLPDQIVERVRQLTPDVLRRELEAVGIEAVAISGAVDRLCEIQRYGMITGDSWPGELVDADMHIFD